MAPAGDPRSHVVAAEHLSKWYGQVIGLNDVTLSVPPGITGLLGPNGAGKSTFMKILTGQLKPSQGTITVLGEPIWERLAENEIHDIEVLRVTAKTTP